MREAATFAIGRSGDRRAVAPLFKALEDHRPSVQVLACLGLAQIDDPRIGPALIKVLADARKHDGVRAACGYALGTRRVAAGVPALLAALADNRGEAQRLAAWSLGQIGDPRALGPLLRAYFARAGHGGSELVWAIGRTSGAGLTPAPLIGLGEFPLRAGKYNLDEAIALLPGELPRPVANTRLLTDHPGDIAAGLVDALSQHRDVIVAVLEDLDGAPSRISLGALAPATAVDTRLEAALASIGQAIEPGVAAQVVSDDPKVRALAVSVLAKLDTGKPTGDAAIARALGDPAEQVRGAAMNAVVVLAARRGTAPAPLTRALVDKLASPTLSDRMNAAVALGRLRDQGNLEALIRAAGDPSGFVREAVAHALANVPSGIDALLALSRDEIYQVRAAAARSLGTLNDARGHERRGEMTSDPDPTVRAAAGGS